MRLLLYLWSQPRNGGKCAGICRYSQHREKKKKLAYDGRLSHADRIFS